MNKNAIGNFLKDKVSNHFITREGMVTSDNDLYLRLWHEVCKSRICFNATDCIFAVYTGMKWFPYNKGGDFRRWYGNNEYVVNWYLDGKEIKSSIDEKTNRIRSHNYNDSFAFLEGITWSKISSGMFSARLSEKGFMFDTAGTKMFLIENDKTGYLYPVAFINSKVAQYYLTAISPTLNNKPGDILHLPFLTLEKDRVDMLSEKSIDISKADWDSFETSWNFKKHPLI